MWPPKGSNPQVENHGFKGWKMTTEKQDRYLVSGMNSGFDGNSQNSTTNFLHSR